MATINYVTLKFPAQLIKHTELIQALPHFNVYRYTHQPGIIFRIPRGVKTDDICHFFIEHEINLSNTLRTGTLTMKAQVTVVPCHMGVFSGYQNLEGSYKTVWYDEQDYGEDHFKPNYNHPDNVKKIVPLPVNMKTNLYEYLNEILFEKQDDLDIISKYAVQLGCQRNALKEKVVYIPAPDNSGKGRNAAKAHAETKFLFESAQNKNIALIPEQTGQGKLF
jgi:hypothetical protein